MNLDHKISLTMEQLGEMYRDKWREKLPERNVDNCSPFFLFAGASSQLLENDRVVQADVLRTRAHLVWFRERQKDLSMTITQYCNACNVSYRQGLNEILAPFLVMEPEDELRRLVGFHNFFASYIAPFYFGDFQNLQITLSLIESLLLYHAPTLAAVLILADLDPVVYATPWILTLFVSKMDIVSGSALWDRYICEKDVSFVLFLTIAILMQSQDELLETEFSSLPEVLSGLTPTPLEEIWTYARQLKVATPPIFINTMENIFKAHMESQGYDTEIKPDALAPENQSILQAASAAGIPGAEALGDLIGEQRDDDTKSLTTAGKSEIDSRPRYKSNGDIMPAVGIPVQITAEEIFNWTPTGARLVIFDSRSLEEYEGPNGRLPQAMRMENAAEIAAFAKLVPDLTALHFCIIDNLVAAECAIDARVAHVSTLEGGYEALHEYAMMHNCELVDHVKKKCELCSGNDYVRRSDNFYQKMRPTYRMFSSASHMLSKANHALKNTMRRPHHAHHRPQETAQLLKMPLAHQLGEWKCKVDVVGQKQYEGPGLVVLTYENMYLIEIDEQGRRPGEMQPILAGPFKITNVVRITAQRNKDPGSRLFYFKDLELKNQPKEEITPELAKQRSSLGVPAKPINYRQGVLGFAVRFEEKQAEECTELVRTTLKKRRASERRIKKKAGESPTSENKPESSEDKSKRTPRRPEEEHKQDKDEQTPTSPEKENGTDESTRRPEEEHKQDKDEQTPTSPEKENGTDASKP